MCHFWHSFPIHIIPEKEHTNYEINRYDSFLKSPQKFSMYEYSNKIYIVLNYKYAVHKEGNLILHEYD